MVWSDFDKEINPPCFCVGPQNGQPLCPCKMRRVKVRKGRYVLREKDLGPVIKTPLDNDA